MKTREALCSDAAAIAAIRERTIRTVVAPLGLYTPTEVEAWVANFDAAMVATLIARGNYYVASDAGRVVGFARLQVDSPPLAVIRGVFVDADFIGIGVGGALVDRLLVRCHELDARAVELVSTLNARTFYERWGFTCLGQVRHTTATGAVIPGYEMTLELRGGTDRA